MVAQQPQGKAEGYVPLASTSIWARSACSSAKATGLPAFFMPAFSSSTVMLPLLSASMPCTHVPLDCFDLHWQFVDPCGERCCQSSTLRGLLSNHRRGNVTHVANSSCGTLWPSICFVTQLCFGPALSAMSLVCRAVSRIP